MKTTVRHWKVHYGGFWHHFLDFRRHPLARQRWGYQCVVELVRFPEPMVRRVHWQDVLTECCGAKPILVREAPASQADVIFHRTARRLESRFYNLVFFNCEHFANECMIGRRRSRQVREKSAQATLAVTGSMVASFCLSHPEASMWLEGTGMAAMGISITAASLFISFVVRSHRGLARARRLRNRGDSAMTVIAT